MALTRPLVTCLHYTMVVPYNLAYQDILTLMPKHSPIQYEFEFPAGHNASEQQLAHTDATTTAVVVLAMGPGNLAAVRVRTANTVQFSH